MERLFSLSQLVAAVLVPGEEPELLTRRVRHWSLVGALPTAGAAHTGKGKHRRYGSTAIYLAAILHRLADRGLPIGILKGVTEGILHCLNNPKDNRLWKDAIAGRRHVFLYFLPWHPFDAPDQSSVPLLLLLTEDEFMSRIKQRREGGIFDDLTHTFSSITPD